MAEYMDEGEEDLRHLEDESPREAETPTVSTRELPDPLYRIRASHSNETYYAYWPGVEHLAPRSLVVAPTRYGKDICETQGMVEEAVRVSPDELLKIERLATPEDLERVEANRERERKAFELCRQKIEARRLPMKLVAAHYLLDEPKVLFFFSADSRVDFRELVKDLVSVFKMRIELRQIGVRDEARVTGGCGVCGRVLCCHGVSDKLTPVSIKMAKDQNLSLNSMKISGPCGRLLCCLAYEYGFYRDARRELPGEGVRFQFEGVLFRVIEVNALNGTVKAAGEDGRVLDMAAARFMHSEGRWQVREDTD
jgi:cell fate regulator YaaT (PSP1 superfamily)